jgi:hypothetical protein
MTSRFGHVWLKLDRAKQHNDDLEGEIVAFHRTNPYHVIIEDDPQTGRRTARAAPGRGEGAEFGPRSPCST